MWHNLKTADNDFHLVNPKSIRNVCILAHVDHGKTTVADLLLATNGLVSRRSAGFVRYLDDRKDEQERGITMKSSAASLLCELTYDEQDKRYCMNLIDTPGHIDFSTEVAAAVRISEGALIIVDIVEGICAQTKDVIKQAYDEKAKMILVINKIDRLILDLSKTNLEIFQIILRIIEDCNVFLSELSRHGYDSDVDGSYFMPECGNVIFASATDRWGFTTRHIAKMYIGVIKNETIDSLNKKLWNFDYYVDLKIKEMVTGAIEKGRVNAFVQLCLAPIHHVYSTIVTRMEREKIDEIARKLCVKNLGRDINHTDPRVQLRTLLEAWNSLARTVIEQCERIIPCPLQLDDKKIQHLLNLDNFCNNQNLRSRAEMIVPHLKNCLPKPHVPAIAYISKMFSVNKKNLSQNKPKIFVPNTNNRDEIIEKIQNSPTVVVKEEPVEVNKDETVTIALARVFSGVLKAGQTVYFLSPSYDPTAIAFAETPESFIENSTLIQSVKIKELYIIIGRELLLVEYVGAGTICGISGLEEVVQRTGTISTTHECIPFHEKVCLEPIVRNSIQPVNPSDLLKLCNALKVIMQSDSCLQVLMQDTGDLVLLTAGDVHLAKCLEDLKTKFPDIEVTVSSPMVALRETIENPEKSLDCHHDMSKCVECPVFGITIGIVAVPLPSKIECVIKANYHLLQSIENHQVKTGREQGPKPKTFTGDLTGLAMNRLQQQLYVAFNNAKAPWMGMDNKIWSVGKSSDSINLLINNVKDYKHRNIFTSLDEKDPRSFVDHCIVNAFNEFCQAGPICQEPLMNCVFVIKKFKFESHDTVVEGFNVELAAMVNQNLKSAFKLAFQKHPQRLMEPLFATDILVNTNILGRVYLVVNRRHGKVVEAIGMDEEEKMFMVKALLPVVESTDFANEMRKTTSGQANPHLRFSHYAVIEGDPFCDPDTYDVDEEPESENRANKLMKAVRRRKGLDFKNQVVLHAEKQRTLNKKK